MPPLAGVRIEWDYPKIAFICDTLPRAAHQMGLQAGASASSADLKTKIKHSSTGRLAADVARPKQITDMMGAVGSDLVYAGIQDKGGTIRPVHSDRLLIHGISGPEGETIPGARYPAGFEGGLGGQFATQDVVASATEVTIEGKHYLDVAEPAYAAGVLQAMRTGFPR